MQNNLLANTERSKKILQDNSPTKWQKNKRKSPRKKCQKEILQKKEKEG